MDTYICNVGVTKAATTTSTDMQISCPLPSAFMDGTCNDMNNIADCNWDGDSCLFCALRLHLHLLAQAEIVVEEASWILIVINVRCSI